MALNPVRLLSIVWLALGMALPAAAQDAPAEADMSSSTPATSTVVRFDPGRMPKVETNPPALGWRFGQLSNPQTSALRRGFKLPLDALARAESPQDLMRSAVIAPLPDPSRPMLAVKGGEAGGADPFSGGMTKRTSFRDDPMRALGEWLGVTGEESSEDFTASSSDPFAADAGGGFDATPAAEAADDEPDPFAGDDDGDDPFADF